VLERVGEALVDVGGGHRQPVLERQRKTAPHDLDGVRALPHPGPDVALQPECSRLQVGPARGPGQTPHRGQQAERGPQAPGRPQVGRRREDLDGGLGRQVRGREGRGRLVPAGEGLLPPPLELEHRSQAAQRRREAADVALPAPAVDDLTPRGTASAAFPASSAQVASRSTASSR
jgi:hypothetical protein